MGPMPEEADAMTIVVHSQSPDGRPWITARLRCDGCNRWGPGPIGSANPADIFCMRARLRIAATAHEWRPTTILIPVGDVERLVPHRIDLCPWCRQPAGRRR
jgi:hypothetical protein